jgi:hypothetical protein
VPHETRVLCSTKAGRSPPWTAFYLLDPPAARTLQEFAMGKRLKQLTEGLNAATKLLIALAGVIGAVILIVTLLKPFASSSSTSTAPTNQVSPAISGQPAVGDTLSCVQGSWSGSPVTFDYAWDRDGAPIGDSAVLYTVAAGDVGQSLTCMVTAANAQRQSARLRVRL